jgi:hypothetical protein
MCTLQQKQHRPSVRAEDAPLAYPTSHLLQQLRPVALGCPHNKPFSDDMFLVWSRYVLGQKIIPVNISYGFPEKREPFDSATVV